MTRGSLPIHPFNDRFLFGTFGTCCCIKYLLGYLDKLQVSVVLEEPHYIDRHYLDDFVDYYAKSFNAPSPHTSRYHFFRNFTPADLDRLITQSYHSVAERDRVERELEEKYLGFIVKRPLKSAAIGRTVLTPYPVEGRRRYAVVRPYRVHVAGLRLKVLGLAYQQQDRGAAVCASTALWVALQRVAHVAGHRTPTPAMITEAANSPYPASHGLNEIQMASALSATGYVADYFAPGDNLPLFRAKVVACLDSQLPVILLMIQKHTTATGTVRFGHAVTVTGYSDPPGVVDVPSAEPSYPPTKMLSGSLETIYVHDDNLGSHAHYELFDSPGRDDDGNIMQMLRRGRSDEPAPDWWNVDEWIIVGALVPKPDKLRLPVENLFSILAWMRDLFQNIIPGVELIYRTRFTTGIDYKRDLFDKGLDPRRLRVFQEGLDLPRHVGVISVFVGDNHILDTLLDVTEIQRDREKPPVLAFAGLGVPERSLAALHLTVVARIFDVPFVTAS